MSGKLAGIRLEPNVKPVFGAALVFSALICVDIASAFAASPNSLHSTRRSCCVFCRGHLRHVPPLL